jgi:hypothetical protein
LSCCTGVGNAIIDRVPGYEYDVFISYSSAGSAPKWLRNNFYQKFMDCLHDQVAPAPRVFLDKGMARGVHWPAELQKALRHSKIMIAVLSPPYFESPWCLAEWRSMRARENLLGLASPQCPQGLIYPLLYSDSENFPDEEGLQRAWWNFKELALPDKVFQESRDWLLFHQRVCDVARDVVELVKQVPDWRPDWPVIDVPKPLLLPQPSIPRFSR